VFASILNLFFPVPCSLLRVPAHRKITILANLGTEDPQLLKEIRAIKIKCS
jgi:hypothetical protein